MARFCRLFISMACLLIIMASGSHAGTAEDLLQQTHEFYESLDSVSVTFTMSMAGGGMPSLNYKVAAAKPNTFAMHPVDCILPDVFIQDGESWYTTEEHFSIYIQRPAVPAAELSSFESDWRVPVPGGIELSGLLCSSENSILRSAVVEDHGAEEIESISCRHLTIEYSIFITSIWIAESNSPWVMQIRQDPQESAERGKRGSRPSMIFSFHDWTMSSDLGDPFVISPDPAFTHFAQLPTSEQHQAMKEVKEAGAPKILGQAAPEFSLGSLDGTTVNLSDLKGRVVVLDFWATWCAPCVKALPIVTKVTKDYADQGVVFYAVNQRETSKRITAFLAEKQWSTPVLLDPKSTTGDSYGVLGIPVTVVIDRDGVVRHSHSGYDPGMEQQLRSEIEGLLELEN